MRTNEDGEIPTVLGVGSHFDGLLTFRGAARVDGSITGTIHAVGRLVIGPDAHVRGQVEVDELVVAGLLEGDVRAHRRAELLPTGRVIGDLVTPRIKMAEGGVLQGSCRTARPEDSAATPDEGEHEAEAPDSALELA